MSAEKPEVNDVWKHNKTGEKRIITHIQYGRYWAVIDSGFTDWGFEIRTLIEDCVFIGKSKANVADLFCVKENGESEEK